MKRIGRKLGSKRGASITFALLLFLVCAMVSSVVIVAGTAAAGRMSEIAMMDQRYYTVASAAELLQKVFLDKAVEVTYTKEDPDAIVPVQRLIKTDGIDGIYYVDNKDTAVDTILRDATERVILSLSTMQYDKLDQANPLRESTMNLTAAGTGMEGLNCTIVETLDSNRLLQFVIRNNIPTDSGVSEGSSTEKKNYFEITLTLTSDVQELAADAGVDKGKAVVKWSLHSLRKRKVGPPKS